MSRRKQDMGRKKYTYENTFLLDEGASDEESLFVDIHGRASVVIENGVNGISVFIYSLQASDRPAAFIKATDQEIAATVDPWPEKNMATTSYFWNCECEQDYIRDAVEDDKCSRCGAVRKEQPDSRVDEVRWKLTREMTNEAMEMIEDHVGLEQWASELISSCFDRFGLDTLVNKRKRCDWTFSAPEETSGQGFSQETENAQAKNLLDAVDWEMLSQQKATLLKVMDKLSDEELSDLKGILHLLDNIQDFAVDTLGMSQGLVFKHTMESTEK